MKKKCELCGGAARIYCESDLASLCWECDEMVHGANFLAAKHTRCLLCQACQSLTPWKASGPKLVPTFSVCDACVSLYSNNLQQQQQQQSHDQSQETNSHEYDHDGDDYDDEEEEEEEDYGDEEDSENQVVPWSGNSPSSLPTPPPLR